ncbi:MAG: hypothetical protein ACI80V_000444 [Rhodothermales bacterium]|jgi:hypothetical protein
MFPKTVALSVLLCLALSTSGVQAQDGGHGAENHICGTEFESDEARQALANFKVARTSGMLARASKTASPPDIGETKTFRVSESGWVELDFQLVDKEEGLYYLWVSADELATGRITETVIRDLRTALVEATPGSIINQDAGILANNETVLGPPPDYDGDGVTDVLMYDIDPADDTPGSFTAGYVHSADLNPNAGPTTGNQADVLYLDSNQGISSGATASTAAHEYAHLIHFNTGFDTETFISEGIAEYLTVVNGLGRSRYSYLTLTTETEKPLFSWGAGSVITNDYARAELFFRYVGEQFSPETVASIAGNPHKGAAGIDSVLQSAGSSLDRTVLDFHSANLVNDRRIGYGFGYNSDVQSSGVKAAVSVSFGGGSAGETPRPVNAPGVESGSVNYISFTNISDLRIRFDVDAPAVILASSRETMAGRLIYQDEFGAWSARDLPPADSEVVLGGNYFRVHVVFANTKPGRAFVTRYIYEASWLGSGDATPVDESPELPEVVSLDQNYPNPFNPVTAIGFELPETGAVKLVVFDQLGRPVQMLVDGVLTAGNHVVTFDGSHLGSGSYLYVLTAGGRSITRQLTLLK